MLLSWLNLITQAQKNTLDRAYVLILLNGKARPDLLQGFPPRRFTDEQLVPSAMMVFLGI